MNRCEWATLLAILVLAAGCSDGKGDSGAGTAGGSVTPSPSPAIEKDARYGTVDDLKDAAVEAGYDCPNWHRDNKVTLAAQSGTCSDEDVFSTYSSETNLQQQLETHRENDELFEELGLEPSPRLVGPNWIINTEGAEQLQEQLGGTVEGGT